jgi:hypothetical protein
MARKLNLGKRQLQEKKAVLNGPGDQFFILQCPTNSLFYNFNEFANFGPTWSCRAEVFCIPTTCAFCGIPYLKKFDNTCHNIPSIPMMGP